MKQWVIAAIVLAALVTTADAQRPEPAPAPKPPRPPRVYVSPDVHVDTWELAERAREMAERFREDFDATEWQLRAEEMAERFRSEFDASELQLRAEELAERAMSDFDASELQWRAREMAERAMADFDVSDLQWRAGEMAERAMADFDFDFDFDFDHDFDFDFDHDFDYDYDYDHDVDIDADVDVDAIRDRVRSDMWDTRERMRDAQERIRERERDFRYHELDMSAARHIEPVAELAMRGAEEGLRTLENLEWSGVGDLANIALSGVAERFENRAAGPRASWAPNDPADSLYRLARESLNRGNYRRAAQLFQEISARYPTSQYAPDALYWEAFALYRIGSTAELERARTVLEAQRTRYADAYARSDGASLAQRVAGALAQRGDQSARVAVTTRAGQQGSCDKEDLAVRVEALNALSQLDFASARPILERVLGRQDACTVGLRKRAVFLIGKQGDPAGAQLLSTVIRNEPNEDVRGDAILWLSRVPGDQTVTMLDELLRSSTDERVQRTALRALAAHDSPRARQIVRATIVREDASERLREYALSAFASKDATAEDAAFLRDLYPRLTGERMKKAVVRTIGRIEGSENKAWLTALIRNDAEPIGMRSEALSRFGRSSEVSIRELVSLYDGLAARELREQLISTYARRKEPEATDKLLDIAKTGTDPHLRRMAISALTRKNDPRTTQLLLEIIEP